MAPNSMPAEKKARSATKADRESSDSAGRRNSPFSMTGATRRKHAITTNATLQTASSSSERATPRQPCAGGAASAAIVLPSVRTHSDMKRNEVHSANRNPTVNHPWLVDERAQRTISLTAAVDSVGSTPRSTCSSEALKSRGIQRLTSAMEMPTKGTSDSARKKAISAAPLSASTNLAAAALGLAQSMIGEAYRTLWLASCRDFFSVSPSSSGPLPRQALRGGAIRELPPTGRIAHETTHDSGSLGTLTLPDRGGSGRRRRHGQDDGLPDGLHA